MADLPDYVALSSVVTALREELVRIKDRLDLFVRSDRRQPGELDSLLPPLRQVADTLAVLGFGQPRKVIIDQLGMLQTLAQGDRRAEDAVLMDVAGALLYVEATLSGRIGSLEPSAAQAALSAGTASMDLRHIHRLVIGEARLCLRQAKESIFDYDDSDHDRERLKPASELLTQVRGALAMLSQNRAAALVLACHDYLQPHRAIGIAVPTRQQLDDLVDAMSSIDYYLDQLDHQPDSPDEGLLDLAEDGLMVLGYEPPTPDPVDATTVLLPSLATHETPIDDELREVFLEEASEILATAREQLAVGRERPLNHLPLIELRRVFHTLKGSGRIVHALVVSELAWAMENLLNRVLEGHVLPTPRIFSLLDQVLRRLPDLLAEFALQQQFQHADVDQLTAQGHDLSLGEVAGETHRDGVLQDIFYNEALTHLDVIERFLQQGAPTEPEPISDDLQRALHTLKGSALVAGMTPIAELAAPLDQLMRELRAHQLPLEAEDRRLLTSVQERMRDRLTSASASSVDALASDALLIDAIDARLALRLQLATDQHSPRLRRDPQLITHFLALGVDILLDAESLLKRWRQHPQERQELSAILEELTTLGEGAHLADLTAVDELCEALLDLYGGVEESSLMVSERFFHEAELAHDALIDMLDEIAAGQEVTPRPARVDALRALLEEGLDPSAMGHVGSGGEVMDDLAVVTERLREQALPMDLDDDLVELFLEEALDLLGSADQSLHRWLEAPGNGAPLGSLQQDLYMLKGGARLAGLGMIEQLAEELEQLYEGLIERKYQHGVTLQHLLLDSHVRLRQLLQALESRQPLREPTALIDALQAFRQLSQVPLAEPRAELPPAVPEDDRELLDIFLEEGFDIIESSGAALARWRADPRNPQEIDDLLRDLHTLKGGARMVEIAAIGDLVHELEYVHEKLASGELTPEVGVFDLLQQGHDILARMLDATRERRALPDASDLMAALHACAQSPALVEPLPFERESAALEPLPVPVERNLGDMVKVPGELLEDLGNLAGEASIVRGRIEQQVNDAMVSLHEMETTIERMRDQLRRLDTETQGQILSRQHTDPQRSGYEDFDPLEMDRHSQLQQLSRALFESASDLLDLKETLMGRTSEAYRLLQHQARVNTELQEGLMRTRMVPFVRMVPRLQRVVRQVAAELGKQVELEVGNAQGEMDRGVLERMLPPLEHMLRNAVDHGLESTDVRLAAGKSAQGSIHLELLHEGADIVIELSDDGAGVPLDAVRAKAIKRGLLAPDSDISDHDVLQFILQPGFSTAAKITQISGRGLGMDVVHEEVKQLGGSMSIDSRAGVGARFTIRLPFTVSVNRALMVQSGEESYAIPLNTIEGIVRVMPAELRACYQLPVPAYEYAGRRYELRYLGDLLGQVQAPRWQAQTQALPVLLVHSHDHQVAVQVDAVAGSREIVVKSLGAQFSAVPGMSGATILGDGNVVLILDLLAQIRASLARQQPLSHHLGDMHASDAESQRPLLIMVVDDSITVRKVTGRLLERHGMQVLTAKDGIDAMALLKDHHPDVLLLDIEMPRMDGFEVATKIRHNARLKDLPIIMITSRTGQKHRDRAMAIGVNEYLGKPYQEARLLESIGQWSGRHA